MPGPDPVFRKTEGTVSVLGMSSFSGEEQKANDQRLHRLYSQMMGVEIEGASVKGLIETKPPQRNLNPCV